MITRQLIHNAQSVLAANDMGEWTRPTPNGLYPHQWLWDSFFIAIGLRHYNIERAKAEVRSPFRAQWKNGMLPHIIFGDAPGYHAGPELWHCERSKKAPATVQTSGVTQPPMAAEAVVRIGELLPPDERRAWYAEMYPKLLRYHTWLYRERDPRGDGLVVLVLPWESGMDNSPPWVEMLQRHAIGKRLWLMRELGLDKFVERFRKDTKAVPAEERISTLDLYAVYDLIKSLRRKRYDHKKILARHKVQVVDVTFNCILIRANHHLKTIAKELGRDVPAVITHALRSAPHALETLWDDKTKQYYSRDAVSGQLIRVPSVGTFMPLYAKVLPQTRVRTLMRHLYNPHTFAAPYPVPSAPLDSPYFKPHCYWQGPLWININWLIIEGLHRNNQPDEAEKLRKKTLALVAEKGMYEYYSPLDAKTAGASGFSWTAALTIDLLERAKER